MRWASFAGLGLDGLKVTTRTSSQRLGAAKIGTVHMTEILTVTLNPSIDLSTSVEQVLPGKKLRCDPPLTHAGGGGVNVARAIALLGDTARALIAVGGSTGQELRALLAAEGIATLPVNVSGKTRNSLAVIDETSGKQYRFGFPGAEMTQGDADALLVAIAAAAPQNGFVVVSGSLTPGLPDDYHQKIQQIIEPSGAKLIVDTSGPALLNLLRHPIAPLYILRVDRREAAEAAEELGHQDADEGFGFATSLVMRGVAEIVMSGRGKHGSVMVTKDRKLSCSTPDVPVRSRIGAGDAFLAGVTLTLARGADLETALRTGVAAASATVMTEGTELCRLEDVERILPECQISLSAPHPPD
jgi:6-phosphofructokinase 2